MRGAPPAHAAILSRVSAYYGRKLADHGPVPRGVDWNSGESQTLRFAQLAKVLPEPPATFSVIDFGCGYGAFADYLLSTDRQFEYAGCDVSEAMVQTARELHRVAANCSFMTDARLLQPADFTVASGIFNVKMDVPVGEWEAYLHDTLDVMAGVSTRGFAFNVLTKYSDPERMRPDLYYADPCELLDYCARRYSRHVALLHDYGLYEFSVLVRTAS